MIKQVIYYGCSLTTTIICIILKIPQLIVILKSKSAEGISISSLLLELWAYLTFLSYSIAFKYPFMNYSEYPFLVAQDVILIFMVLYYKNNLNLNWISTIFLMLLTHLAIAFNFLPSFIVVVAIQIGSPIAWYSKGLQLWIIVSRKNAGQVSEITWGLNSISTATRLLSIFLSIWDKIIMTSLFISLILNGSVAIAAYVYKPKQKTN